MSQPKVKYDPFFFTIVHVPKNETRLYPNIPVISAFLHSHLVNIDDGINYEHILIGRGPPVENVHVDDHLFAYVIHADRS